MNPGSASISSVTGRPIGQGHGSAHPAVNEDQELEQIMRDVGAQLKKEEIKPPKRRLFNLGHKPKREVPFTAQIVHDPNKFHMPAPAPLAPKPIPRPQMAVAPKPQTQPAPRPADAAEHQLAKIQPHPNAKSTAMPKNKVSYPFFVLFVTLIVTGFLIAAAIAAYRQ